MVSGFIMVAVLTVGAKVISFLKDAAVARQFGTGDAMDAFVLSFGFLTFLAALVGGGLPEAFLPLYAEAQHQRTREDAHRLAVQSSLVHLLTLGLLAAVLYPLAPQLVAWTAQGFPVEKQALAVDLLRRLLPFLVCFGMSYQVSTWLRADKAFTVATCAPMLIPASILAFLFAEGRAATVDSLVTGTLIGALLHLAVLLFSVSRTLEPVMRLRGWHPDVRQVIRNAFPYLFAGGIFSSTVVVDQTMAAWLQAGSVAVLGYTDKVCGIILAVTAAPACDVLFPYFADKVARRDWAGVRRQLVASGAMILAVALPATLLLCWLAPLAISLLFERGSFTPDDTERVASVLRIAVLQIPFFVVATLASRVAVAMQATRFIMALSVVGLLANAGLNWLLMQRFGVAGIALSTVIVQMLSAGVACVYVSRQISARAA
jgi:putative peptidoglycan lipid II flippase